MFAFHQYISSVSAKTANVIDLSRCGQNAVIFLTHPDNLH